METIVKAFKIIGGVNTYIGDTLDRILAICKFSDEVGIFIKEYLHEHPDEFENIYTVFKCSNPSFSIIIKRGEKFLNDQEQILEAIVKRRLQSGEDEILLRNSLGDEEDEDYEDEEDDKHN